MAYVIPKSLPTRGDVRSSVQDVARVLRDHDDDQMTVVWNQDDPDGPLWVIDPSFGAVFAIHVLDGGQRSLQKRLQSLLGRDVNWDQVVQAAEASADSLRQRIGDFEHVARDLPVQPVIVMPGVSRERFTKGGYADLPAMVRDDLDVANFVAIMRQRLGKDPKPRLTATEEKVVRAAITPQIVIRDRRRDDRRTHRMVAFRAPEVDDADVIAVLDRQQQELALHLGDGYRVVRGVAGSGKSLVLTHRAKYLADTDPDRRVLVTCYNVVLARALAAELADYPNVDVHHLDSFAYRVVREAGASVPKRSKKTNDWVYEQRRIARELLTSNRRGNRYDAVLVDETQDFDNEMLDIAYATLRADDFVVALDGAQNIYRKTARWNPPNMTAQGRTTVLRKNYRNTHEILDLAYHMLTSGGAQLEDGGSFAGDESFVEPEAASRSGDDPVVYSCRDEHAEIAAVCDQLEAWHGKGVAWSDMLVLFGDSRRYQGKLYYECQRRGIPYYCVSFSATNRRDYLEAGDVVRSSTIQSIKGIEFGHVAICGVNQMAVHEAMDEVAQRRLLYVGMTRATDKLVVTVSGSGRIGADLLNITN